MKLSQFAVAAAVVCCLGVTHAANYDLWEDETTPVSYEMEDFESQPKMESKFLRVYTMPNCPPCEAWKRDVWPKLQAKGWEEGVNVEFVTVTENAPRFEWVTDRGVESVSNGYRGRDSFNAWHRSAVDGVKAVANGCQCGPDCPCVARASYSGPRERVPNPDFVMTELVGPSAVFTEYDEPQGILDGGVQSYQSAPQASYSCANGQCGPVQAMPVHQQQQGYWTPPQQSHQSHGYRGPVRRVLGGLFSGGCLFGGCR